jgi:hypothetical protein
MASARDPGLQPQRTGLAWLRTSLSILAVALLCLRTALTAGSVWSLVASLIGASAAVTMLLVGGERPSYSPELQEVASRQGRRIVAGIAGAVMMMATLETVSLVLRLV